MPGQVVYNGAKIQILDLPGIIQGAKDGKGRGRQVIAVEFQGHGHTADIDRPFTYEQLADDTAALIQHLGLEQADVYEGLHRPLLSAALLFGLLRLQAGDQVVQLPDLRSLCGGHAT